MGISQHLLVWRSVTIFAMISMVTDASFFSLNESNHKLKALNLSYEQFVLDPFETLRRAGEGMQAECDD
jgi:hypothetical protein